MTSKALVPRLLARADNSKAMTAFSYGLGVALLCVLSRIYIPLPWTAVPITGQTFGVAFLALMMGARLAVPVVATYLALGAAGLPVFAMGGHGLVFGPTLGYLIGMFAASLVVGALADRGFSRSFPRALVAAYLGSAVTFTCGLFVLSYFVPRAQLATAGLYPFLIGDFVKNTVAALLASRAPRG